MKLTNEQIEHIRDACPVGLELRRDAPGETLKALAIRSVPTLCAEVLSLRKQADLDRQSREASQREFARLNRELNEARETAEDARHKVGVLLHEIAHVAIAHGMMRPDAPPLDGPNAILFLHQIREREETEGGH